MAAKTVYERMACAGAIVAQRIEFTGQAPHRTHVLVIEYQNGLIVALNGDDRGFVVERNERLI